ncbi:MAG: tRNA/rRNA methyltransferase [Pelagibacterales bacterium]|nr:tRNA/rRNA methyltransferase [Pelagibacterales bacterium]
MSLKNTYFILCRPQLAENIGSSARALKNFNMANLRLVNPRCSWPNPKALATSVGAKNILHSAKVYKTVDESIGDLDVIFASTSRSRKVNKNVISITDFTKKILKNKKVGIIFGPESSGLSNDEINSADYLVTIPTNKNFSSLNLSHSLILFCFQIFQYYSKKKFTFNSTYKSSNATKSEVNSFLSFIIKGLDKKGFLQPNHKRQSMIRNINNIFHRLNLSEQEIRILLGIFTTLNDLNNKS